MTVRGCSTFWKGLAASFFCLTIGLLACFLWVFIEDEAVVSISPFLFILVILSVFICGLVIGLGRKFFWKRSVLAGLILAAAIAAAGEAFFPSGFTLRENLVIFLSVILSSCVGALVGANCSLSFQTMKQRKLPGA